jgi:hypothetical protein
MTFVGGIYIYTHTMRYILRWGGGGAGGGQVWARNRAGAAKVEKKEMQVQANKLPSLQKP